MVEVTDRLCARSWKTGPGYTPSPLPQSPGARARNFAGGGGGRGSSWGPVVLFLALFASQEVAVGFEAYDNRRVLVIHVEQLKCGLCDDVFFFAAEAKTLHKFQVTELRGLSWKPIKDEVLRAYLRDRRSELHVQTPGWGGFEAIVRINKRPDQPLSQFAIDFHIDLNFADFGVPAVAAETTQYRRYRGRF